MKKTFWILSLIMMFVVRLDGQLTGNNLLEYQLGNLPHTEPAALSAHYDQLNLAYRHKGLKVSTRYEHFFSQNESSSYYRFSQVQAHYRKGKLELKVGTFNETLDNGLLARGYDITGSVYEDEAYRSRYGFYRDMLGFSVKYSGDVWFFHAMRGKSLVNNLPPTLPAEERRVDLVEAVQTGITLHSQSLGVIIMRDSQPFGEEYLYSLLFSGSLLHLLSYNLEFAHDLADDLPVVGLDEGSRYGIYGSLSMNLGSFGLSAEYKNYHNLLLGSGINDPPTAVREQKYKVLNRSIHVPQLLDESGVQFEAYYTFPGREMLVVNYTRAVNQFFQDYHFNELFLEFTFQPGQRNDITLFGDITSDQFKFEDTRLAGGVVWDHAYGSGWSTQVHLEHQYIERAVLEPVSIHNSVAILGVSRSPDISFSLIWELSSDPAMTDLPDTPEEEGGIRHWAGVEASYRINPTNSLTLFAGKRRGGPACTSGICYEVLDFEGVEIRFKTKF